MVDRHDNPMDPIPGAPADSLVGLGGSDGFVGQCDRERCLSTPPPPPPEPEVKVTRSYPPIPIPSLPEMPLRARMLRPWMGAATGAVLIAVVGMATGGEEPEAATGDAPATMRAFGGRVGALASAALKAGEARAERRAAERAEAEAAKSDPKAENDSAGEDGADAEAEDSASSRIASGAPSHATKKKNDATSAFDRDAARSAIFAAASRASGCRTRGGPKGRGRATVTIGPNGNVISVSVSPPFAGTKSGHCVASVFRAARIAPFSGSPVTLGKSFSVR